MRKKAVLTGDIILSRKMTPENKSRVLGSLQRQLKVLDKAFSMKSEIYRGDSFQCLLQHPYEALRVALLIKTNIRSLNPSHLYDVQSRKNPQVKTTMVYPGFLFDARISIGIGETDGAGKDLATSGGEAFYLSGLKLDQLKNEKQSLAISTEDEYQEELETESILLDAIISKTTALQCQVLHSKLLDHTEIEIAKKLKIGQSAVNQRSNGGNWNAIYAMIYRFEEMYPNE